MSSLDRSITTAGALKRFLDRCPVLRTDTRLSALSQKGEDLTVAEVVAVIADPFLHPSYTIPLIGCFRPLARQITERAVSKLQAVPSFESENDENGEDVGDDDIQVIDFYLKRGRGLRLHEIACLSFARALDLVPSLLPYLRCYLEVSPPPFRRFWPMRPLLELNEKVIDMLLDAIRVSYRLLYMEPKVFSGLWDWSYLLNFINNSPIPERDDMLVPVNNMLEIKWCIVQISSIVFKISDRLTEDLGLNRETTLLCLLRWEDFCQDTSLEKAGWYHQPHEKPNNNREIVNMDSYMDHECLSVAQLCQLHIEPKRNSRDRSSHYNFAKSGEAPFVLTLSAKRSFEMVFLAVNQKWPVLLYGPVGSGKTTLINKLAHVNHNRVIAIHMDMQMDSKVLIGSYVCTEQPGEFRWQPGTLTQAVGNGYWVVLEDLDKAPNDVHSLILPLLEGSCSFVAGNGEEINVDESFRLFATMSTMQHDLSHATKGSVFWTKVHVGYPNKADLLDIVNARYSNLGSISVKLVDTFECVNSLFGYQVGAIETAGIYSRFSLRDLLKWCKRISDIALRSSSVVSFLDSKMIYQEAFDVFVASLSSLEKRISTMSIIANIWGIPQPEAKRMCLSDKPIYQYLRPDLQIGRVILEGSSAPKVQNIRPFAGIRTSLQVLEKIACSVKYNEPVLLVGETGTGKTTLVQSLATWLGHSLTIVNLSQQSDIADLLGGFKPTDPRSICIPLYHEFKDLFCKSFSRKDNEALLQHCEMYVMERNWKKLLHACQKSLNFVQKLLIERTGNCQGSKRKRPLSEDILNQWELFATRLDNARKQISASAGMSFAFVEGAFITALKKGHWILLDEVNLAPSELLQRLTGVLDGEFSKICLTERGDIECIERHSGFRLFACMNPATDAGKRELPYAFRNRFTEYFVDDVLDDEDLTLLVSQYLNNVNTKQDLVERVVDFYKAAKKESEERLQDGAKQKPQFSLRSLARALEYTKEAAQKFKFQKALYDGFSMFFLTLLDRASATRMDKLIVKKLLGNDLPPSVPFDSYFNVKSKVEGVTNVDSFVDNYVLTKSVKEHLKNIARAVYIRKYPVLLQGPTSSGKTSLVRYLAIVTGNEFVRINNHEHTDLQEYFGSYITDSRGKLQFQEGVLVRAVRKGYWIVLDELNLAPSDVLEALNRLLDDNRELFVPELQEKITAHPDFMLFATQNPPMIYGGRKILSRAFRNRFLEVHVDEIPGDELRTILEKRCMIPASYAAKMVEVMEDLQLHRQNSRVFAGKHGFITPRDLFRWANRFRAFGRSYDNLAEDGYYLLGDRLREEKEKNVVRGTLERRLHVKMTLQELYKETGSNDEVIKYQRLPEKLGNIVWSNSMRRLFFLVERCYKMREPVLLVGETGGGKTTVCQLLSLVLGLRLHILNCHQYSETSDFLGGFYPVRDRSSLMLEFKHHIELVKTTKVYFYFGNGAALSSDITEASLTLDRLNHILNYCMKNISLHPEIKQDDLNEFECIKVELVRLREKWQTIFLWQDGPLVQAMKNGDLFLMDEISLADDSVLERLNSVLEPERKLSLAEKGGSVLETVSAHPNFFILATMNPGGDYGKKELSPALRNRFTEIWVDPVSDVNELRQIALDRLKNSELSCFVDCVLNFWQWFNQLEAGRLLTVRDLLSWISFINLAERNLKPEHAFIHGAFLVLLDGLSLGTGISKSEANRLRSLALSFLLAELEGAGIALHDPQLSKLESYGWGDPASAEILSCKSVSSEDVFGIDPFYIPKGDQSCKREGFQFLAPTTNRNVLRVLRAMQLPKPVLLEGSPGVGKTSLVVALAEYSGHNVVRINLSEQTDMMDLLGSDLPVEAENGMEFSWSDGILLQALKSGSWVLLDELNLAPQAVLEGLNAILDHRAEVYIPELGLTFKCPPSFRVFACQNPTYQGGGRKGLPKSFLNRFTKVYVDELGADDYLCICQSLYPSISKSLLSKLILFNSRLYDDTMVHRKYGQEGSPWEFNLRDIFRSCQIIEGAPKYANSDCFLNIVYLQRMRTASDRREVLELYESVFGVKASINFFPDICISPYKVIVGNAVFGRNHFQPTKDLDRPLDILPGIHHCLEAAFHCIENNWMSILVGPSSSGKTSLVRLLAQIRGTVLHELNLSSGTDVSELLGCFEQYSALRTYKVVISNVERYVLEFFSVMLKSERKNSIDEIKTLGSKWFSFVSSKCFIPSMSNYESGKLVTNRSLDPLVEIIEMLKCDVERYQIPVSWTLNDLNMCLKSIVELQKQKATQLSAKFEWVPGNLIRAIEHGEWVVLENANLCNPTVLDRINSLAEPNGFIMMNERGLIEGKPVILHAHPKFRMFLTVDPKYGEVSRAMRNRGIEIYLLQPTLSLDFCRREEIDIDDAKTFLVHAGIPQNKLIQAMTEAHRHARSVGLHLGVRITLLELSRWVQLFQQLLISGNEPMWSLHISWEHIYVSSLGEAEGRDAVMKVKLSILTGTELFSLDSRCPPFVSGGWPMPLNLKRLLCYSKETHIRQNCSYLELYGIRYAAHESSALSNKMAPQDGPTSCFVAARMVHKFSLHLEELFDKSSEMFDFAQAKQKLFIAANWTFEQATVDELTLYLSWFKWYSLKLHPYCRFFKSFWDVLEQEREYPIWNYISEYCREFFSYHQTGTVVEQLPVLSPNMAKLARLAQNQSLANRLDNGINCLGLLRLTLWQWITEVDHMSSRKPAEFPALMVLRLLRRLEEKVLKVIHEEDLFNVYSSLLEYHTLFWRSVILSHFEHMLVAWSYLKKKALNFKGRFPEEVDALMRESSNLISYPNSDKSLEKSMLWVNVGHPFMSSSASVYIKMLQLLSCVDAVWPRKISRKNDGIHSLGDVILSTNSEVRKLAVEGICMSSYIITTGDQDEANIVMQLDELYQRLVKRFECERRNFEDAHGLETRAKKCQFKNAVSLCCFFPQEILQEQVGNYAWMDSIPLFAKCSLSLDMVLLLELTKCTWADAAEVNKILSGTCDHLQYALDYSVNFSPRSPVDFVPHQMILWIFDAWNSVDDAHLKLSSCLNQMWFNWHSLLWSDCYGSVKNFCTSGQDECSNLAYLSRIIVMDKIIRNTIPIEHYDVHLLRLKVMSRSLWQDVSFREGFLVFLHSSTQALFRQIIFAHKKSYEADTFQTLKTFFSELNDGIATVEMLQGFSSLVSTSSNKQLTSLEHSIIEPLVKELYSTDSSYGLLHNVGSSWFLIGALRFQLLVNKNAIDPATKYTLKHSWLLEKISLLEVEIKVRQECCQLAGRGSNHNEENRIFLLKRLEADRKRLQKKVVYRPEPPKYKMLMSVCADFVEFIIACSDVFKKLKITTDLMEIVDVASNWQVTSATFIDRISEEFTEYADVVQPIQVAVYEMKLGLSMAVCSAFQKGLLSKLNGVDIEDVEASILSLMQFARSLPTIERCKDLDDLYPIYIRKECPLQAHVQNSENSLLEKLVRILDVFGTETGVSSVQLQAIINHNLLIREALNVSRSLQLEKTSFSHLDKVFSIFVCLWMDAKTQQKAKEEAEAQSYKFRPRVIKAEDVLEGILSSLTNLDSDENVANESDEELIEREISDMNEVGKQGAKVDEEWNLIPESILHSMVMIHNDLFGSHDLSNYGVCNVKVEVRLQAFVDSYEFGIKMMKGLWFMVPFTSLDDELVPEHFLRVCLEHEKTIGPLSESFKKYNFYKDSNASEMFAMVETLIAIRKRVEMYLTDWPGHPGLEKVLDVTQMLLAVSPATPLSKALLGLQSLVRRAELLQESISRFSFNDLLQQVYVVIAKWQKLELECWPTLLEGVLEQHEMNAAKLWFPLRSVLHRNLSRDDEMERLSTLQSLEEFIQTSSLGEFKRRLHLLLAFHGQIHSGMLLNSYSSRDFQGNLNILYNSFGYYMQFLPLVVDHIASERKSIEKDLTDQLKLFKWEHPQNHLSLENFKRTRHKIWKLVQKFNEILQQPVMVILNQEAVLRRDKVYTWLEEKVLDKTPPDLSHVPFDLMQLSTKERFLWFSNWKDIATSYLANMQSASSSFTFEGSMKLLSSEHDHRIKTIFEESWILLGNIYRSIDEFAHIWKYDNKSLKKRRALRDLLKVLEESGLSRHKSMILELEHQNQSRSSFEQPSYDVVHLLLKDLSQTIGDQNANASGDSNYGVNASSDLKWKDANAYYFKNLYLVQQVRQICLNFHKDLTLELVRGALSFLEHLIIVQQEQRSLAYSLFEHLKKLGQQMHVLGGMQNHNQSSQGDTETSLSGFNSKMTSVAQNQNAVSRGMWWQKHLLDSLISMSKDVLLLFNKGQSCHTDACNIVNVETDAAHVLFHKFIPMFVKAKESVDQYLLGTDKTTNVINKCQPMLVTKEMEQSVTCNFQTISVFTEEINQYLIANPCLTFKNTLLNRVKDLLVKGKKMMDAFQCELEANQSVCQKNDPTVLETFTKLNDTFSGAYQATNKLLIDSFSLLFNGPDNIGDYPGDNITSWKCILKFLESELNLNQIYDSIGNMIMAAGNLANFSNGSDLDVHFLIEACVKNVYSLLTIILTYGERILAEFLDVHFGLTMMTNVLAQIFMVLVSKGYGCAEEPSETTASHASQEATGTGMGEGEGTNDVSDQLDDEAQLLGTSEKNEGLDNSNRIPSDKDKGIEMDEDFPADTFSVSEGSDNDNNSEDDEDMNIESKMGNEADGTQTVAEKPWDNDEDDEPNNSTEKYESGPSVNEIDASSRELRAKEDDGTVEESEELDHGGADMLSEGEETEAFSDNDITDDNMLDKSNAYEDPTGAQFQCEDFSEDKGKDETQISDMTDAVNSDFDESDEEIKEQDEKSNPVDHVDDNSMQVDQHPETKEEEENAEMAEEMDMEPVHSHKENFHADKIESFDPALGGDAAIQENEPLSVDQEDMQREMSSSEKMNRSNNLAPSRKSPTRDTPNNEITIPDSSGGLNLASDKLQPLSTERVDSLEQKLRPNPYRSLGDAMDEWKERVNVSNDLDEQPSEALPDIENENAAEYRYVSEAEKGTSQARGSATLDQVKDNPKLKESEQDGSDTRMKEKDDKLDVPNENSETQCVRASHPSLLQKEKDDEVVEMELGEDTPMETAHTTEQINCSGDIISFKSSYMTEKIDPVGTLHLDGEPSKVVDFEEQSDEGSQNSMAEWKRYEMSTTKLSQELAEQLRLVLEPTLASKLQGDYKTGKRINMKKVIPYIASHFRKDKIWLRRTQPNKRDYQVVVAIDDSRSMSEGHVGNIAIEALVTVCRAMSQLEVGQLAVASFGDKENIKMLLDFDQPFTGEAGAKMISSLSFKHDNQHANQPVTALLEHLNKLLDDMVERAGIRSGHNPLNQLILIIADSHHFNESRDLKRRLRDVLSSRRMIAYIIVDSAEESVMDQKMISYETGKPSLIKAISAFPFPYYIVLKNIEVLPRTLADLLRQWFELMQNSNE